MAAGNILEIVLSGDAEKRFKSIDQWLEKIEKNTRNTANAIGGLTANFNEFGAAIQKVTQGGFGDLGKKAKDAVEAINKMVGAMSKMGSGGGMGNGMQSMLASIKANTDALVNSNRLLSDSLVKINAQYTELLKKTRIMASGTFSNADKRKIAAQMTHQQALDELNVQIRITQQKQEQIDALRRQYRDQKALLDSQSRMKAFNNSAYGNAMAMSEQTIQARIKKMERLRTILAQLNKDETRNAEAIRTVKNKMKELDNENKRVINSLNGVKAQMKSISTHTHQASMSMQNFAYLARSAFNVYAIFSFLKKIVDVTGEFELQHKAMQAIIGDIDQANALFDKTVRLAVKSPYRIKDLVSYTKQLAAYRIETDKLYETNKMLADISSGLGVDMQRLVLAYGQVKAANYLRGQELRQFSEAGVNILGELAKYFSEIQGRAITTGEVFDMVSKRMVKFEDVNTVLKRLTSEGGIFFNMQEIQAETLKGQIENLRDSFDLFFNEIGSKRSGTIVKTIKVVRNLLENINDYMPIINTGLAMLVVRFAALQAQTVATAAAERGWMAVFGKNIQMAIAGWRNAAMVKKMENAETMVSLKLRQKQLAMERQFNAAKAAGGSVIGGWASIIAVTVTAAVALYAKLTANQRKMRELKNEVNGIVDEVSARVPEEMKQYKVLTQELERTNYNSKERSDIIGKINSQYGEYLDFQVTELTTVKELSDAYESVNEKLKNAQALKAYQQGLEKIHGEFDKIFSEEGNKLAEGIAELGLKAVGEDGTITNFAVTKKDAEALVQILKELADTLSQEGRWDEMDEAGERIKKLNEIAQQYFQRSDLQLLGNEKRLKDFVDKYKENADQIENLNDRIYTSFQMDTNVGAANEEIRAIRRELEMTLDKIETTDKDQLTTTVKRDIEAARREAEKQIIDVKIKYNVISESEGADQKYAIDHWASRTIESVNDKLEQYAPKMMKEDFWDVLLINEDEAKKSLSQIKKDRNEIYKADIESINELNQDKALGIAIDEKQMETLQRRATAYKYFFDTVGWVEDKNKGGSKKNPALELLNKQIEAIKNATKQYDEFRKMFSDDKAWNKTKDAVAGTFSELNIAGLLDKAGVFDRRAQLDKNSGLMQWLSSTIAAAGSAGDIAAEKYLRELQLGIDNEDYKPILQSFKDKMDGAFADLDMGRELEKMGVGKDFASIVFGVDTMDLDDVRNRLEELKSGLVASNAFGTDAQEEYDKYLKKITEMEDKEQKERLKKYAAYAKQAMSERARIQYEGLMEIADIEEIFQKKIEAAQKAGNTAKAEQLQATMQNLIAGSKSATDEKLNKQAWEDFKASDMYVEMFEDIDNASTKVIQAIRQRITELRDSMNSIKDPVQLKAITKEIQKLDDELASRTPLKAFSDALKRVNELRREGNTFDKVQDNYISEENELQTMQQKLDTMQTDLELRKQWNDETIESKGLTKEAYTAENTMLEQNIADQREQIAVKKAEHATTQQQLDDYENLAKQAEASANYIKDLGGKIGGIFSDIMSNLEMFGGETTETSKAWGDLFSSITDIIATIPQYILLMKAAGVAANQALGVVGWIVTAVQLLVALVKGIAGLKDARIDDEIARYQESVEKLEASYERLEKAFDKAWDVSKLRRYRYELEKNVNSQIDYLEKQIAAEQDRKSPDEKQIRDWQNEITDLRDTMHENTEQFLQDVGGIGESTYKDLAGEFVDAWYDAFKETGDGLDALQERFEEVVVNMVKRQAVMRLTEKLLDPLFTSIDRAADDGTITKAEMDAINALAEQTFPELNEKLKEFFGSMGLFSEQADSTLTGLQEGIQGVTEATAEIIAAYLNSLRFYVIDSNSKLAQVLTIMRDTTGQANPMLTELRNISQRANDIYDYLYQRREDGAESMRVFVVNE